MDAKIGPHLTEAEMPATKAAVIARNAPEWFEFATKADLARIAT